MGTEQWGQPGGLSTHGCCSLLLPACSSMGVRTRSVGTTQGPITASCPAWVFSFPPNLFNPASPYPCNVKEEEECPGCLGAHTGLSTLQCCGLGVRALRSRGAAAQRAPLVHLSRVG